MSPRSGARIAQVKLRPPTHLEESVLRSSSNQPAVHLGVHVLAAPTCPHGEESKVVRPAPAVPRPVHLCRCAGSSEGPLFSRLL